MRNPSLSASALCFVASLSFVGWAAPDPESAPEPPPTPASASRLERTDRLELPMGRLEHEADPERLSLSMHGEFQLRYRAARDLKLAPPLTDPAADSLGQQHYLYDWLRLRPELHYRDQLKLVGQFDVPRGIVLGDTTQWVSAARDPGDELQWSTEAVGARFRYLYLQYTTPIGLFRVGQQGSHWALGLLANDGDHPTLFGDVRRGSLVERVLFATKPLGRDEPLRLAIAGDLVFEDSRARLADGDRALQVIGAALWETSAASLGVYGGYRHQRSDAESVDELTRFAESLEVGVVSVSGRFATDAPTADVTLFGQFEGAFIGGSTDYVRNIDQTRAGERESIQAFGGALRLGALHETGPTDERWGDVVVAVELGYASGDADPGDGVTRRFTFDQNHNVGLVLFDHVLAWKTARAATIAADPSVIHRAAPGLQFVPSEGGVFGAAYLYPTVVVRPVSWVDLKAGMVLAQTTADLVDPFHYGALGDYANYDGGDERKHDLGVEFDLGADLRLEASPGAWFAFGVEGGLLIPGGAFDDALGRSFPLQYLLNTKLGLLF